MLAIDNSVKVVRLAKLTVLDNKVNKMNVENVKINSVGL